MAKPVEPTGLPLVDGLSAHSPPTIDDYCQAAAEYIRQASVVGSAKSKAAQNALAHVTVADLERQGVDLRLAFAGEREVGGGLRSVKADVSEMSVTDGLRLAIEIKPVHLAVGRAIWNRFGDVRTFAVNIHSVPVRCGRRDPDPADDRTASIGR